MPLWSGDNVFYLLLSLTILFNLFDLMVTLKLVSLYGKDIELNPIAKALMSNSSNVIFFKLALLITFSITMYVYKDKTIAKVGNVFVFLIYGLLTCYHLLNLIFINVIKN